MAKQATAGYDRIKQVALRYVEQMKIGDVPGRYKKEAMETGPSLYGSYHAAHILDLFGELEKLPDKDLDIWAQFFLEKQTAQGYFSNKAADKNRERLLREMDQFGIPLAGSSGRYESWVESPPRSSNS